MEAKMVRFQRVSLFIILIASVGISCIAGYSQEREPDVYYVPTPEEVVIEMLQMAQVSQNDIVYDLGCGDGRIVITAAKVFGARGVGVDIDPVRIKESNENARKAGVTDRVKFIEQDLFKTDISEATVVSLYLYPELNLRLRPKLFRELRPGTRIVSHEFDMEDWKPDNMGTVRNVKLYYKPNPTVKDTNYYYWVVPADVAGIWHWTLSTSTAMRDYVLSLVQNFQEISGNVSIKGHKIPISEARLVGDQLSFTFSDHTDQQKALMRFNGRIKSDTIQGNVEVQGGPLTGSYSWTARRTHLSLHRPALFHKRASGVPAVWEVKKDFSSTLLRGKSEN
jgi:SAM-dependent methyltransferase